MDEFHFDHDNQHTLNMIITQNPSCPRYYPLEKQLAKFKQFLGWYRNRQAVKTFSQWSVKIFDWYLADVNKQCNKNGILTKDQVKALGEQARFIVKSFKYTGRLSARSAELGFYITKLVEAIEFDPRCLHETTYQEQILK